MWLRRALGGELRLARILSGFTQAQVARRLGKSRSYVSRAENGLVATLSIADLTRHAAIVGLTLYARLFPAGRRVMDGPQLALLERFRSRLSAVWKVELEVPMPIAGDLRAADALISIPGCRCMVEVITRLADFQAQLRSAHRKQRDLSADQLVFVVLGSTTNRRVVREAAGAIADAFPLSTKAALSILSAGDKLEADALIVL